MSKDCIFCKIASGEIPSDKIYEDEDVVAFKDINPQAPMHIVVIPRKHFATLNDLSKDDLGILTKLYNAVQEIARKTNIAESGYRTIVNTNRMAGQEVFHLHLHIMGGRPLGKMG